MKTGSNFSLPFEIDQDGVPTLDALRGSQMTFQSVVSELDEASYEHMAAAFQATENLRAHFYDAGFDSIARLRFPASSIPYHCAPDKWYSSLNVIFQNEATGDSIFISDEKTRSIFIGSHGFVMRCLELFPLGIEEAAENFFKDYGVSEDERTEIAKFISDYSFNLS